MSHFKDLQPGNDDQRAAVFANLKEDGEYEEEYITDNLDSVPRRKKKKSVEITMQTKNALKTVLDQAAVLRERNEAASEWNPQDAAQYATLITQAKSLKSALDNAEIEAQMKSWLDESAGSAVKAGFSAPSLPTEGAISGVSAEAKTGELYALDGVGAQKLAALKSAEYKDAFVSYLRGAANGNRALKAAAMKVLNEGTDTAGGFWVPPDYRSELVKKMATMAAVRPNAYSFTTGSDVASFPKVTYTADDKYTSGARFSWVGSTLASDQSETTNPVAGRENIPVHTALCVIRVTRAQMEDNSFDILGYITDIMSEAFVLGEEDAFINGTGVGQPQGLLNHPQATTATASGGMKVLSGSAAALAWGIGTAGTAVTTGITGVDAALPPQYESGAKWLGNKATYSALFSLTDSQGRPLWAMSDGFFGAMQYARPQTLLGYSWLKSQFMPDIAATAYPLLLGDLSGYYIADRVGLSVEVDNSIGRLKDEVVIVARKRVGGQLVHYWKTKLLKSNNS